MIVSPQSGLPRSGTQPLHRPEPRGWQGETVVSFQSSVFRGAAVTGGWHVFPASATQRHRTPKRFAVCIDQVSLGRGFPGPWLLWVEASLARCFVAPDNQRVTTERRQLNADN